MEEIWKDVVGYEGLYKVSNLGRVKSLPKLKFTPTTTFYTKERICVPRESKGGYLRVGLSKNGRQTYKFLHRIVIEAFLGVNKSMTINHKDEDKCNNCIDNLEYMSRADNVRYGTGIARAAQRRRENPYNAISVNQYTLGGEFVARYKSSMDAMRAIKCKGCGSDIIDCCRRKRHTARGFIWRFDGDEDLSFVRKSNARHVIQMSLDGAFIAEYPSIQEAAIQCGVQNSHICSCCNGVRQSTGGYTWKYKDD